MEDRGRYIDALEHADAGDLGDLVTLVLAQQRGAAILAVTALGAVVPNGANGNRASTIDNAVESAKSALLRKGLIHPSEWARSSEHAERLVKICGNALSEVAERLRREIANAGQGFSFGSMVGVGFGEFSQNFDFPVNPAFERAAHLMFNYRQSDRLSIVFASVGLKHRGMLGVKAFWSGAPLENVTFQINYCEPPESIDARFNRWLENAIASAISLWQQTL